MLNCETNTPEMEERIKRAFEMKLGELDPRDIVDLVFEHDQWWVIYTPYKASAEGEGPFQYSVVDAQGLRTFGGFDFELLS